MPFSGFSKSLIGGSHIRGGKPCQDSSGHLVDAEGRYSIGIVSDGHGGTKYIRSKIGSGIAVEVSTEVIRSYLADIDAFEEALSRDPDDLLYNKVGKHIVARWYGRIAEYEASNPLTEEEKRFIAEHGIVYDEGRIENKYGATLLINVLSENFAFSIQIGDGDIVYINRDGSQEMPVPEDGDCQGNITSSICQYDIWYDKIRCYSTMDRDRIPAAMSASSDGLSGTFPDLKAFTGYIRLPAVYVAKDDADSIASVEEDLLIRSKVDDDVSLSVICDISEMTAFDAIKRSFNDDNRLRKLDRDSIVVLESGRYAKIIGDAEEHDGYYVYDSKIIDGNGSRWKGDYALTWFTEKDIPEDAASVPSAGLIENVMSTSERTADGRGLVHQTASGLMPLEGDLGSVPLGKRIDVCIDLFRTLIAMDRMHVGFCMSLKDTAALDVRNGRMMIAPGNKVKEGQDIDTEDVAATVGLLLDGISCTVYSQGTPLESYLRTLFAMRDRVCGDRIFDPSLTDDRSYMKGFGKHCAVMTFGDRTVLLSEGRVIWSDSPDRYGDGIVGRVRCSDGSYTLGCTDGGTADLSVPGEISFCGMPAVIRVMQDPAVTDTLKLKDGRTVTIKGAVKYLTDSEMYPVSVSDGEYDDLALFWYTDYNDNDEEALDLIISERPDCDAFRWPLFRTENGLGAVKRTASGVTIRRYLSRYNGKEQKGTIERTGIGDRIELCLSAARSFCSLKDDILFADDECIVISGKEVLFGFCMSSDQIGDGILMGCSELLDPTRYNESMLSMILFEILFGVNPFDIGGPIGNIMRSGQLPEFEFGKGDTAADRLWNSVPRTIRSMFVSAFAGKEPPSADRWVKELLVMRSKHISDGDFFAEACATDGKYRYGHRDHLIMDMGDLRYVLRSGKTVLTSNDERMVKAETEGIMNKRTVLRNVSDGIWKADGKDVPPNGTVKAEPGMVLTFRDGSSAFIRSCADKEGCRRTEGDSDPFNTDGKIVLVLPRASEWLLREKVQSLNKDLRRQIVFAITGPKGYSFYIPKEEDIEETKDPYDGSEDIRVLSLVSVYDDTIWSGMDGAFSGSILKYVSEEYRVHVRDVNGRNDIEFCSVDSIRKWTKRIGL